MVKTQKCKGQINFSNYGDESYYIVGAKTGEIKAEIEPKTEEEKRIAKKYSRENQTKFKEYIKEHYGIFYFNYYNKSIDNTYLFRFMYLCTYMNYENYVEFGSTKGSMRLATKKDIKEILKLQKTAFNDTYNDWIKNKMIIEDEEGNIQISDKFCNRGQMRRKDYIKRNGCVRMFDNGIKELYEKSSIKEHKQLGMLVKLLPYINYNWNIVCSNPTETDIKLIKPLKQKEIYEILNVDKKTVNSLTNITIMNRTEGAFVKLSNAFVKNAYIINPKIMYKSNDTVKLQTMSEWFVMGKDI